MDDAWFWKYVTYVFGSLYDCYVGSLLDDEHLSFIEAPIQAYENYGETV